MKRLVLLTGALAFSMYAAAQCPPTVMVTQNPLNIPCNGSATLTANLPMTDVDQPQNNACMANFQQVDLAQSFVTTVNSLCGAGVFITADGSGSGVVTLALYTNLPNVGGVLLGSGSVTATDGTWADVTWPAATVIPGNTYYIVMTGTNPSHCVAGSLNNPYSGGMVYANSGYQAFPSYDYTFHTTACNSMSTPTYAWSTGGNTSSITVNASGVYTVTVSVAACTTSTVVSTTVTVTAGPAATSTQTNVTCPGGSNGTASVNVTGGNSPYSYSWMPSGGNGSTASGLSVGTYTCIITDASSCSTSATFTITAPPAFSLTASTTNVLCNGQQNGTINFTASGGTGVYSYNWNNGAYTTEDLFAIGAGVYNVVVTDQNGCTTSGAYTITEPALLVATVSASTNPSTCGGIDGSIDISVSGGTTPYAYAWSNGGNTQDLTNLAVGPYSVTVTDINGCTGTTAQTLIDPPLPVVSLAIVNDMPCVADGPYTLTGGSPTGGTYSGTAVTSGAFDPSSAGVGVHVITYTYTDASGCTASNTDSITVDICLNTTQINASSSVTVYPNPNNGAFSVLLNGADAATAEIHDVQGKLVQTQKIQAGIYTSFQLNEPGVYMLTVIAQDGSRTTQRIVVAE